MCVPIYFYVVPQAVCLPNASSQWPNICVQIIPDDFKTVPDTSRCLSDDLQMLPDRCLPDASRC